MQIIIRMWGRYVVKYNGSLQKSDKFELKVLGLGPALWIKVSSQFSLGLSAVANDFSPQIYRLKSYGHFQRLCAALMERWVTHSLAEDLNNRAASTCRSQTWWPIGEFFTSYNLQLPSFSPVSTRSTLPANEQRTKQTRKVFADAAMSSPCSGLFFSSISLSLR